MLRYLILENLILLHNPENGTHYYILSSPSHDDFPHYELLPKFFDNRVRSLITTHSLRSRCTIRSIEHLALCTPRQATLHLMTCPPGIGVLSFSWRVLSRRATQYSRKIVADANHCTSWGATYCTSHVCTVIYEQCIVGRRSSSTIGEYV